MASQELAPLFELGAQITLQRLGVQFRSLRQLLEARKLAPRRRQVGFPLTNGRDQRRGIPNQRRSLM